MSFLKVRSNTFPDYSDSHVNSEHIVAVMFAPPGSSANAPSIQVVTRFCCAHMTPLDDSARPKIDALIAANQRNIVKAGWMARRTETMMVFSTGVLYAHFKALPSKDGSLARLFLQEGSNYNLCLPMFCDVFDPAELEKLRALVA
jgi:hypothetical protein